MTPQDLLQTAVRPALDLLHTLTGIVSEDTAVVLTMAIWGQEGGNWQDRLQIGGPARGFPQFEKGGGVAELFAVTPIELKKVCDYLFIPFNQATVFEAMAWNDTLAACMTRLLLWQDRAALPAFGDEQGAYDYYLRNWRPGAPSRSRWAGVYPQAMTMVAGTT